MVKTKKSRAAVTHRSADSKGLPPGWIRVESRSKPGAYFYAHPATKRTQTEHPSERNSHRDMTHISSKRPAGPRRRKTDEGVSPMDVEDFEDPAEKAERLRQEAEEAEAAEAARQEMVRQQRAAKRALLKEAEDKRDEGGSEEEKELVSKEELQKWKEDEERREQEEAEAERRRKEEEERKKREEEEAERRQIEEQERRRKEAEEEERRIEAEKIALWKARTAMARKEAEFEMAMSREKQKKEESDKIQLEAERVRQALLERKKQEAEEETKKAEAELRRKAEAERLRREADAKNQKNQRILEPSDQIDVPCFDVFKGGDRIGRFRLSPPQMTWTIGRCPPVDIRASHETVSRKHAQVNRQGCFTFIQDLGSAHGTVLNGHKLAKNMLERVCSGDNLRFGGSSRTYVYREPSTAIHITRGVRPQQVSIEKETPEPALDSPKILPGVPGKPKVQMEERLISSPLVANLAVDQHPSAQAETMVPVHTGTVTTRSPVGEPEKAAEPSRPTQTETLGVDPAQGIDPPEPKAPAGDLKMPTSKIKKQAKKSSSSSSSSTSSSKRRRKASKSSRRKKKSSSSTSSSKDKKRKDSKKKKRKSSSSTSASAEKKKRKSRSKRKSSSS